MSSKEERFVEAWIAKNVQPEGYDADDSAAERLARECEQAAGSEGLSRQDIESEIGPLKDRMALAVQQATEDTMMARDGRSGSKSVELPVGEKEERLEEEASKAR